MKRKMSVLLALMLLLCSLFAVPVQAETVLKDGLEVTLTTDKESYDALETIYAKLTVKNTNDFAVQNVTTKISAPAGYTLDGDGEMQIGMLAAGEVLQQQISMRDKQAVEPTLPQTGDDSHGVLWSALFVVAAVVLCALMIRNSQAKRVISIFLCVAIIAPYVMQAAPVWAEENAAEQHVVTVEHVILVDEEAVRLTGTVTYDALERRAVRFAMPRGLNAFWYGDMKYEVISGQSALRVVDHMHWSGSKYHKVFSEVRGYPVVAIGDNAFWPCMDELEDIVIPSSINSISDTAFYDHRNPELVIYGDSNSYAQTYARKYDIDFSTGSVPNEIKAFDVSGYQINGSSSKLTVKLGDVLRFGGSIAASGNAKLESVGLYIAKQKSSIDGFGDFAWTIDSIDAYSFDLSDAGQIVVGDIIGMVNDENYRMECGETYEAMLIVEDIKGRVFSSFPSIEITVTDDATSSDTLAITMQPQDKTVPAGNLAVFTIGATGSGLKYQWYYKSEGSSTWSKSSTGTTATYAFTMKESFDGRSIRCKVTDANGETLTSNTVKLALPVVKITTQPKSQTVSAGNTAKFTVAATGDGLKYQWYYKNAGSSTWNKSSTGTTATYSFTMKESFDGRSIRCKVTDKYGNTATSSTVSLKLPVAKITTQPKSQTVSAGSAAKFTVKATGDGLKYQWYYKKSGSSTWTKSSSTKATYSFTMKESYDGRSIRCKVTDQYGNTVTSNTVKLTLPVVKITTQPKSQTVDAGSTAKFTVAATGDGLKYQWYYKKSGSSTWSKSSQTKATYSFTMKESYDGRSIRCKVTDQYGNTATSNTVKLALPAVKITEQPTDQAALVGEKATFTVKAAGYGLTYQWYYKNAGASKWSKSSTGTTATYSFTMKESYDGRQIRCKVTDKNDNTVTSEAATLTVRSAAIMESAHPYEANTNKTWQYTHPTSAEALKVTFSADTQFESGYDYLTITDSRGESTKYTGTQLAGETIILPGSQFSAKLESDGSVQYYGFRITSVTATEWEEPEVPTPVPELDLSNATLDKNTYEPGETINISGIRVRNADSVRFSTSFGGSNVSVSIVNITNSSDYVTLNNVKLTVSNNAEAGDYYIGVVARNSNGVESDCDSILTYKITAVLPTSDFEYTIENGKATITNYTGSSTNVVIPSEINGYPVTMIGKNTFSWCELSSVIIPNSVTSIGDGAFYGCDGLTSINIPDNVTSIGYNAFANCTNLNSIKIPDGVTSIDVNTFCGCSSLTSIVIPDSVTSIGNHVFYECGSLARIDIPDSVTSIGNYVFYGCSSLKNVKISNSVTSIGDGVFDQCISLNTIVIPNSVTSMGYSFQDCDGLTAIYIPQSVRSIGSGTFADCLNLSIYGVAGSYAQTFAAEDNIPFIASTIPDINYKL